MSMKTEHLRGAVEFMAGAADETGVQLLSASIDEVRASAQVRDVEDVDTLASHLGLAEDDGSIETLYMRAGRHLTYGRVEVYTGRNNHREEAP